MENNYYVYAHFRPKTDIPFWIGKGRGRRSKTKNGRNKWWKHIVDKNGFEVRMVAEHLTQEQAFFLEIHQIAAWGRADQGKGPLVNVSDGGEGPSGRVPWNKGKKRPPFSQEWKDKIGAGGRGKKRSKETKQKMREACANRLPPSEETKKLISQNHADVNGIKNPFYRKTHSARTKTKLRKARATNKNLYVRDPNTGRYAPLDKPLHPDYISGTSTKGDPC